MSKVFNDHHQSDDDSENNFFGLCTVSLVFVGEIFVNILFYITSILIVEFLFFDTHGNHIFTKLTEICFLDFCIVGRALEQCGGVRGGGGFMRGARFDIFHTQPGGHVAPDHLWASASATFVLVPLLY